MMATYVLTLLFGMLAAMACLAARAVAGEGSTGPAGALALLAGLFAALAAWGVADLARAQQPSGRHGDGHAQMHHVYKDWHQPGSSVSCCNDQDCRPTRAYLGDDGQWRAWDGRRWLAVPADRVLPTDLAGDGRSHLCERNGLIYCFTPTGPKG